MGRSLFHQISIYLFFLLPLQLSYVRGRTEYNFPDKYFINCGSDFMISDSGRNFTGDLNSGNPYSPGKSKTLKVPNTSTDISSLYQTARVYDQQSAYKIDIDKNGIYVVRLHFYPFRTSDENLQDAVFNVSASGILLLSNFSVKNSSALPVIKEFLLTINVTKFDIVFTPSSVTSLAFVNAIEAFIAPAEFIPDSAPLVSSQGGSGSSYNAQLSSVLSPIHRINMGGSKLTPDNDTLKRYWIPDTEFMFINDTAEIAGPTDISYKDGGSTEDIAPDNVYKTARWMNTRSTNITWHLDVDKNANFLVRLHFCDIVSASINNETNFNLYIYRNFTWISPYNEQGSTAVPFYKDFIVDSDGSGFMSISVEPLPDFTTAFLNGLEIMKMMIEPEVHSIDETNSSKKTLFIIIGSSIGGLVLVSVLILVVFLALKRKKPKANQALNGVSNEGSSYTTVADKTVTASPLPNLNLGLKLSLSEILYATKNFNMKLMIGEGGFGKVYKATLRNGNKVAVKRSEPGHGQGQFEFETEIMVLSKIRHRHLVSLIGYCDEESEMILVYEFMEKGTLRDHLYGGGFEGSTSRNELTWTQRLEICIGAARGLHYLHTGSAGGIIHRDVKSTNILLDENFVAKVADFGLSKYGPLDQTHVSTGVKGSFGYLDPEYFRCLQLTDKSDVYSFGVVLLEVVCARPAIQNSVRREQINLAEWGLAWLKKGELEKIVDPFLEGQINPNSLRKFGETADKCLQASGADRPTMGDVLWDLEYALQLQKTAVRQEPFEDSTTSASLGLPMPVFGRLQSHSDLAAVEGDMSISRYDGSENTASEVFSQLRIDEAR